MIGDRQQQWSGEIDDADEIFARVLGYPKALIPATLEPDPNGGAVDGDVGRRD
jgi:hypothetical protein